MKKRWLLALMLICLLSVFGCANGGDSQAGKDEQSQQELQQTNDTIQKLVEDFGGKLQAVPLTASPDNVSKSIQDNYGDYVSPALLAQWMNNPANAPGRLTSSPWPDRIQVLGIQKQTDDAYQVDGEIIEITSVEATNGGVAAQRPITLTVEQIENKWLIGAVTMGDYEMVNKVEYSNTDYGFTFQLPETWEGYSIVTDEWKGTAVDGAQAGQIVESGPKLSIRDPEWTAEKPRQDIPIMVFTLAQWDMVQKEQLAVSAAPIPPSELGRNSKFVFALPARYNYAFPDGYQEVEQILQCHPLKGNEQFGGK